jgi:hypothetical protein
MKLRTIFLLNAILSLLFALGVLLGPATVLKLFGLSTGKTEMLLAQVLGAALLGFGALAWLARDLADSQAIQAACLSLLTFSAIGFVVALLGMLSQVTRAGSAWLVVALFLLFAAGYAYFQFVGPGEQGLG